MQELETFNEANAMITDTSSLQRTDISERISIAQAYPRNILAATEEAMQLTIGDQKTAQSCFYMKPAGKEKICGPSVRLAEIVAYAWGNLDIGTRITGNDGQFITAEGVCIDLQKNIRISAEVKMSIRTKEGKLYSNDMQKNISNAVSSIALRNAIFRVIPKFVVNKLYDAARIAAVGDVQTLMEKCRSAIKFFSQMGISEKDIFNYFKVQSIENLTAENFADMLAIKNSIAKRILTPDNAFATEETGEIQSPGIDELKDSIS